MTEKLKEAVQWVLQKNAGEVELDRADFMEILERADSRHRKMYGEGIFRGDIDLSGLSLGEIAADDRHVYGWGLLSSEKRLLSRSYSMLML
jgi:hypothetical protein